MCVCVCVCVCVHAQHTYIRIHTHEYIHLPIHTSAFCTQCQALRTTPCVCARMRKFLFQKGSCDGFSRGSPVGGSLSPRTVPSSTIWICERGSVSGLDTQITYVYDVYTDISHTYMTYIHIYHTYMTYIHIHHIRLWRMYILRIWRIYIYITCT